MKDFEELGIEDTIEFDEAESIEEVKKALNAGYGVLLGKYKGIYYSEEKAKLYFLECHDEDEHITAVENYELIGKEIELEEADRLIEEYLNTLKKEEERRTRYIDWLS